MFVNARRGSVLFLTLGLAGCFGDGPIGPSDLNNNNNTGPSTPPQLQVGVSLIDFGDVTYGQSYSKQLHVENVGGKDLVLSGIEATAPFTANYASNITITGGGSTTLVIRYQPTEYDVHDGTFSFWWNQEEADTTADAKDDDTGGAVATAYFELPLYGAVISDVDGDGHDCEAAGGDDCNDEDDGSYPGAAEIWYDGEDQDCLGDDDYDQDGDGFQIDYWNSNVEAGGGDCNDANPDVYPGAPDEWYDNVDSNCDGADDWDQDGDGYRTTLGDRGNDCDDLNADVSPGAEEDATNGIDDDCDGRIDES